MSAEDRAALARSKEIEQQLDKERKKNLKEVLLLLLGTGASGKSTVAKQMQIIYLNGFQGKELEVYKKLITANIVNNMKSLINGANQLGISLSSGVSREAAAVMNISDNEDEVDWSPQLLDAVKALWADSGIQSAYKRSNEFQLSDSAGYFFNRMEAFRDLEDAVVNDMDILYARKRTTGIVEIKFSNEDLNFRMMDVGGQRNERRKWIHCFEGVTAIIFVASLSEWDQLCEEDNKTNRMVESLNVFKDTLNNEYFINKPVLLFLNKHDLFQQKIMAKDLGTYFPGYKEGKNPAAALKWITKQYTSRNNNNNRAIYVHPTTATDTSNIIAVFDATKDIFISAALEEFNF